MSKFDCNELSPAQLSMQRRGKEAFRRKKALKSNPTRAELAFRAILSRLHICAKFQPLVFTAKGYFIPDFVLHNGHAPKIIVEIDGGFHSGREGYDAWRTRILHTTKVVRHSEVLRITNEQVFNGEAEAIMRQLYPRLSARYP